MNYPFNQEPQVKVAVQKQNSKRAWPIVLCVVAALAILSLAGCAGFSLGKHHGGVTVLHVQDGGTVSQLSTGSTRTVVDVVDDVADAVVEIRCTVTVQIGGSWFQRPTSYSATSAGSGVIISEDGTIITNNHVIEDAHDIKVKLRDGTQYSAKLIGTDAAHDIAVIKIEAQNLVYATFGDSSALKVGQPVVVIGNPLGTLGGTVTDGIISALDRDITIDGTTMRLLQTNAQINSGNSGGGMFDLDGRLIGVINAKSTGDDVEGLGFAIPANTALQIATKLLQ